MNSIAQVSKAQRYATYGALLSLGSPIGWAFIDHFLNLNMSHPYLFYYLIFGTCTSFTVFSYIIGRKIDAIQSMSQTDQLTKLFNQGAFLSIAGKIFEHCVRSRLTCSAVLIDIDHFKKVNDEHDHLFGNYVISVIAGIIKEEIRSSDVASRFGGDEFALFLPDTSAEKAVTLMQRIAMRVEQKEVIKGNNRARVTLSIGICDNQIVHKSFEEVLRSADLALYESKDKGRNRYTIFNA